MPDPVRDDARREVGARGLTSAAVAHLTRDALGTIDLAALAPVKRLLKRFFSDEPWQADDDDALAELVGSGDGWWRHELDEDFALEFGDAMVDVERPALRPLLERALRDADDPDFRVRLEAARCVR